MSPQRQGQQWIDDVWIDGDGSEWNRSNPYDGSRVWSGHWASESQANNAILAAHHSFQSWSVTSINDRIAIVKQFASILESKRHILNQTIVAETGKPRWEADTETSAAIGKVQNSIDAILHRRSTVSDSAGDPASTIRYRPLGVMVVLGPFNLPAHLPGAHIVPALLATMAFAS